MDKLNTNSSLEDITSECNTVSSGSVCEWCADDVLCSLLDIMIIRLELSRYCSQNGKG